MVQKVCEVLGNDMSSNCDCSLLAVVRGEDVYILNKTVIQRKLGPDGNDASESVINCSKSIVLGMKNINRFEEEAAVNIFKNHLVVNQKRFSLYFLTWKQSHLFLRLLDSLRSEIVRTETMLIDSFIVYCNNNVFQILMLKLTNHSFMCKVDKAVNICIDQKLASFIDSVENEFDALRDRIKATAITVTETATESSATLGIESAAQALGQAAVGVGITIMVDVALTSHSLYKAKKAKDMGLIDAKQFETKVKKKVCESGFQFIGGTTGSVVGQLMIPIPVVGAFIGGICGSLIGTGIGKGVNYGLFERKQNTAHDEKEVVEFKLIASVLNEIKDRNPSSLIAYIEEDEMFAELNFDAKSSYVRSSKCENQSSFWIMQLFEKKSLRKKFVLNSDENGVENAEQKLKRRYSDSVGILQRKIRTRIKGKKLSRENSLSTSCLDRCCEEITTENEDNGIDPEVIAKSNENKSAGEVLSENNLEANIMVKEPIKKDDSNATRNLMKTLKSFESIIKRKEKRCLDEHDKQIYELKDIRKSKEKYEEMQTKNVKSNAITFGKRVLQNKEDSTMKAGCEAAFKERTDNPQLENRKEGKDVRTVFDGGTLAKITSIWKEKIGFPERSAKYSEKGRPKAAHSGFVKRLFKVIDKKEKQDSPRVEENEIKIIETHPKARGNVVNDEQMHICKDMEQHEWENGDIKDEEEVFLRKHVAYGERIKELVENANVLDAFDENLIKIEFSTTDIANSSNDDKTEGNKTDCYQAVFTLAEPKSINEDDRVQEDVQKNDGKRIHYITKEFITKLKRNLIQRNQKKEGNIEYAEIENN